MAIKTFTDATKPAEPTEVDIAVKPNGYPPVPANRVIPGFVEDATHISYQRLSDPREEKGVQNTARQLLRNNDIAAGVYGPIRLPSTAVGRVDPYTDDGISAAPDDEGNLKHRPAWEAYLAAIAALKPTYAVAIRPDRWVRELTQLNRLVHTCRAAGTLLATESRIYDPSNVDDVYDLEREALLSKYEVARSTNKVNGTMRTLRNQGIVTNPGPRYGLKTVEVQVDFNKTRKRMAPGYQMEEFETAILRRMKDAFLGRNGYKQKYNLEQIAAQLEKDGVPTPRGGKRWLRTTIKSLMTRAINIGFIEYHGELVCRMKGIEEDTETIYTREEFDAILARLAKNHKGGRPHTPQKHTGSGMLYCRSCVKPLHAGQTLGAGRGVGYRCKNPKCPAPVVITAKHAEAAIRQYSIELLANQDHISRINAVRDEDLAAWRALLDEVEEKEREHDEIVRDTTIGARTRATLGAALEDEINTLRAKMNALAPDDPTGHFQKLKAQAYDAVVAKWDAGTAAEQNQWSRTVVKAFIVDRVDDTLTWEFDVDRITVVQLHEPMPVALAA